VDRAVLVRQRLVAARQVDDRQAARTQSHPAVHVTAAAVRSTVDHRPAHSLEEAGVDRVAAQGDETGDPAHGAEFRCARDTRRRSEPVADVTAA